MIEKYFATGQKVKIFANEISEAIQFDRLKSAFVD